jgi:hypothetical protein
VLLASFAEGLFTWFATFLLFANYPLATFVVLIVGHSVLFLLFRNSWWGLIGGFLAGVVTEFITRGTSDPLYILRGALLGVAFLQILIVFIAYLAGDVLSPNSSIKQNFLFALIGCLAFYAWNTQACNTPQITSLPEDLDIALMTLDQCLYDQTLATSQLEQPIQLRTLNVTWRLAESALGILLGFVTSSPIALSVFFATLRQVALQRSYSTRLKDQAKHYSRQLITFIEQFFRGVGMLVVFIMFLSVTRLSSSMIGIPDLVTDGNHLNLVLEHNLALSQWELWGARLLGIVVMCYVVAVTLRRSA